MTMSWRAGWLACSALAVLGLAACTGGSAGPSSSSTPRTTGSARSSAPGARATAPSRPRALREAWRSTGVRPVSPVAVVGSTALVLGVRTRQLRLYALAADTGRVKWQRPVSTAALTFGVNVQVYVIGRFVAYFEPYARGRGYAVPLVVADPATGRVISRSARREFTSDPAACDARARAICLTAYDGDVAREYRVRVADGTTTATPGTDTGYRELGTQLFDPLVRDPEYVSRRANGRKVWRKPIHDLFGPATTVDAGWQFEKYGDSYAGMVYANQDTSSTSLTHTQDLQRDIVSAGFRVADGRRVWRTVGTGVDCNFTVELVFAPVSPVRCRYRGKVTYRYPAGGGEPRIAYSGLDVTVEGFDAASGRTTWQLPFGRSPGLVTNPGPRIVRSTSEFVLRRGRTPLLVNLATGRVSKVSASDTFWCQTNGSFVATPDSARSDGRPERRVSISVRACDANGRLTTRLPSSVPAPLGTRAGDLQLVTTVDAVVAYR